MPDLDLEPNEREPIFQKGGIPFLVYVVTVFLIMTALGEIVWRVEDWLIWSPLGL